MLSLEEAKAFINSIDFSMLMERMIQRQHWLKEDVIETSKYYRNFLFLCRKYSHLRFGPSIDIDEFWHNHILDTKNYIKHCQIIFGGYLQHYPYSGMDGKSTSKDVEDEFELTQKLYFQEFGDYIYLTHSGRPKFIHYLASKFISLKT